MLVGCWLMYIGLDDQRGRLRRTWAGLRRSLCCARPGVEGKAGGRPQQLRARGDQPVDEVSWTSSSQLGTLGRLLSGRQDCDEDPEEDHQGEAKPSLSIFPRKERQRGCHRLEVGPQQDSPYIQGAFNRFRWDVTDRSLPDRTCEQWRREHKFNCFQHSP